MQDASTGGEGMVGMSLLMVFNGLLDAVGLHSFLLLICAVAYMEDVVDSFTVHGDHHHYVDSARRWQVGDIPAERGE